MTDLSAILLDPGDAFDDVGEGFFDRIRQAAPIQFLTDYSLAVLGDDPSRIANNSTVVRHIFGDDSVRADCAIAAYLDVPQDHGAGTDNSMTADRRMAFAWFALGPAQGYPLIDDAVVADFRGLADDDSRAVIDQHFLADLGAGMDLDPGQEPAELGNKPWQKRYFVIV